MNFNISCSNYLKFIPNFFTFLRIILVPIIITLIFIKSFIVYQFNFLNLKNEVSLTFLLSGIFFIVAIISDFLDGFLARKFNWVSNCGKIWDPIADKILTTSIFICFSIKSFIPFYFVIIMVVRDIIIDGFRQHFAKFAIIIQADFFGKTKTILQMISIFVIFFIFNENNWNNNKNLSYFFIQNLMVIFATVASILSGVNYIIKINLKNKKDK